MATYHDEIWRQLPRERPLDRSVARLALAAAEEATPARVLDLGCGDGRLAAELQRTGAAVAGVDPSETALARARRAHPGLELATPCADGRLPFGDGSFGAVVCVQVLQHVADTQLLLSEVRRVLAPGGRLALAVPYHGRVKSLVLALKGFERHHDPLEPVLRFYTRRSLHDLLDRFGFTQVDVEAVGGVPLRRETLLARARRAGIGVTGASPAGCAPVPPRA